MTAKAIRAAGMSWYRAEDYGRILEIMEDADKLPALLTNGSKLPNAVSVS